MTLPVARSADELAAEGWTITWAGTRSAHAGDGGGAWHTDMEGSSWAAVDTSSLGFRVTRNVNYVSGVVVGISAGVDTDTATMLRAPDEGTRAALAAAAAVIGASAVYRPSARGFQARVNDFVGNRYLPPTAVVRPGGGHSALVRRFVAAGAWRVAHVGFERATCSYSPWSSWSRCVCGALGGGGGGGGSSGGGSGLRTRYRHQLDTDLACTPSSSDGGRAQAHDECRCTAAESREEMAGASPPLPSGAGNSTTAPGGAAATARAAAGATPSGALPPTRNAVAMASATVVRGASNSNSNAVRAAASALAASTASTAPLTSPQQQQQQQQQRRRRQTSHRAAQLLFAGAWLLVALAAVRIGSAGSLSRAPGPSAGIGSSGEEATELVVAEQAAAGRPSDFGSGASHGAADKAGGGATSPWEAAAADSSSQHQRHLHQHQHQAATEPDLEVVLTSGQATNVRAASKGLADAGRMVLFS